MDGDQSRQGFPVDQGQLLSEIDAALASPGAGRFALELERQYRLRVGPARRLRLASALRLLAVGVLAALGLDLANGYTHLASFAACRILIVCLCMAAARLLPKVRRPWEERVLYGLPLLVSIIGTEVMGEWASQHYADRYMMAAAIVALFGLAIPPVGVVTSRLVALLAALLFPIVPVLLPHSLPLVGNLDLVAFTWGALALASLIARLNTGHARNAFLHMLRHELVATEMTLLNAELLRLSSTDALTGLPNRRAFDEEMQRVCDDEHGPGLGLALIDIDWFKAFNDTAGHQAGDDCLRQVARLIAGTLCREEKVARYGGEEFAVLWPGDSCDLVATGERLRQAVVSAAIPHPGLEDTTVTISVGLSWQSRAGCDRTAIS
ncbi:MAG: GGDEF domain-containing protein, partial [Janthinobacterium lividum]